MPCGLIEQVIDFAEVVSGKGAEGSVIDKDGELHLGRSRYVDDDGGAICKVAFDFFKELFEIAEFVDTDDERVYDHAPEILLELFVDSRVGSPSAVGLVFTKAVGNPYGIFRALLDVSGDGVADRSVVGVVELDDEEFFDVWLLHGG